MNGQSPISLWIFDNKIPQKWCLRTGGGVALVNLVDHVRHLRQVHVQPGGVLYAGAKTGLVPPQATPPRNARKLPSQQATAAPCLLP